MIKPMLCEKAKEQEISFYENGEYLASRKYDGVRCLMIKQDGKIFLEGRSGKQYQDKFLEIAEIFKSDIFKDGTILDGELCCDTFQHTQARTLTKNPYKIKELVKLHPAVYYVFDVIADGYSDLADFSLWEREETLKDFKVMLGENKFISFVENSPNISELWEKAKKENWEGIIIKNVNSPYQFKRSKDWLKLKCVKSKDIEFLEYTVNPAGVRAVSKEGIAVQVAGKNSKKFLEQYNRFGKAIVEVEYLELMDSGMLRQPVCKEVKEIDEKERRKEINQHHLEEFNAGIL